MANSFDQFETLIREFISPAVVNMILEDDDPAWALIDTFEPMTMGGRTTDGSAGYEAQWKVKVQEGGRVSGGVFDGNTITQAGKDSHLAVGQSADALYLDPTETPLPSWITVKMGLKRILGSITVNHQQIMSQLATQPIDEVAGSAVEDAVSKVRGYITNYFWGGEVLGSVAQAASGATVPETAGGAEVALKTGTFARFKKGDRVRICQDGGTYLSQVDGAGTATGSLCYVVDIDRDDRAIKLQAASGVGNVTVTADDHIVLDGTYSPFGSGTHAANSRVPQGVESLLINSGTFPGTSLDVGDYSDLKAFVSGSESAPDDPTPEAIALILDKISDAGYAPPEALFAERSVWTLYGQLEREAGAQYVVPQGAAFVGSGGVDGPTVQHMGNRFQRFSSVRMRPGSMIGLAPSTMKKYMPLGNKTVHWVYGNGPLAGAQSIFGPVTSGTQLTELADAPFNVFCEFSCDKPGRNFRRVGFKSQRDV